MIKELKFYTATQSAGLAVALSAEDQKSATRGNQGQVAQAADVFSVCPPAAARTKNSGSQGGGESVCHGYGVRWIWLKYHENLGLLQPLVFLWGSQIPIISS